MDTPLRFIQPTEKQTPGRNQTKRHQPDTRVTRPAGRIIITIFYGCEGVLLVDCLPHGTTINGLYYVRITPSPVTFFYSRERWRETYGWCAAFSRQHICSQVQHHTGFIELNHPPYSLDITPNDYHLSSNRTDFESDNERELLFGESWF